MISTATTPPHLARLAVLAGHFGDTIPNDEFGTAEQNLPWAADFAGPAWGDVGRGYLKAAERHGYVKANRQMHEFSPLIREDLYLAADDADIRAFCDRRVKECARLMQNGGMVSGLNECCLVATRYGLAWPVPDEVEECELIAWSRRLVCKLWWRRQIRTLQAREVGRLARVRGQVAKYRQAYIDDWNLNRYRAAQVRNLETLEQVVATNEEGQEYTLAQLAELGPSNLTNRRHELMVRMRGFEEVAEGRGHVGEFWTFTLASRWHRMRWIQRANKPVKNSRWKGADPKQAQEWLCKLWSQIRACMARNGIRIYGFRVAEPHHDGCPHWHLLVFMHPADRDDARRICSRYLLKDDPNEPGAKKYRFDAKAIDPAKGTAAGYVAKYIAKNTDGANLNEQDDDSGLDMAQGAERVRSWANSWKIHQFQQIGGPSVTVWRELRRLWAQSEPGLQADLFGNQTVEAAGQAADKGDWASFVEYMGGPTLPRDARPARPAYWTECEDLDPETGELLPGTTCYGDPARGQVFGLWIWERTGGTDQARERPCLTRFYRWEIEHRKPKQREVPVLSRSDDDLAGVKGVPSWLKELAGRLSGQGQGIAARWSCPFSGAAALDLCQ
ncbi:replication endonuclease [Alcanivorax sp.]|uniref:replication endonuclease n=1 Tax=Alcanivorax sp. TaxID=1872427 RepID=UPI000C110436|nr:replication endonuclease [Alcanivorax sp.]PHR67962.1 MAG: hypothetical protein COA55_03555 [Alcanivorax sp.]